MRMGNFWIASLLHSLLVLPLPFTSLKEHFWYHVFICPWVLPHFVILLSNPITCIEPTHSYKLTQFISTILTVTYDILNYLVNGLGPFSFIKKKYVSCSGPVSIVRWKDGEMPTHMLPTHHFIWGPKHIHFPNNRGRKKARKKNNSKSA
jgi:hypothetical protein